MIHRRFPSLPPFRRPRAARDVWDASSEGIAAAGWADTFRVEHADLVGAPPGLRPDRQRWLVAACILGLVVMAAVLHVDLRRVASGSNRNGDVEQRRTAIAEAVSQELVRTREAFEAYRVQAGRDISSVQEALAVRETVLRQAEQAHRVADSLAADRARAIEAMTSDLASARRAVEQARAETAEAHAAAHAAAQAAQAALRKAAAVIEPAPPTLSPDLNAASTGSSESVPAEAGAEPLRIQAAEAGALDAGEGPRFHRSSMAWLPLADTAFMALDAGSARTDATPVASAAGGTPCGNGFPALPHVAAPHIGGKGARSIRADAGNAGLSRMRQRTGVKAQPAQVRGGGARQRRVQEDGPDAISAPRPASRPDRS